MTEQQLANEVLAWMKTLGWISFHVRNSGAKNISQVQGDKGFPDLVGIHRQQNRILVAELKIGRAGTAKGDPRQEQWMWLNAFAALGNIEMYVWRPEDLPNILKILRGKL